MAGSLFGLMARKAGSLARLVKDGQWMALCKILRNKFWRPVERSLWGAPEGLIIGETNLKFWFPRWVTLDLSEYSDFAFDLASGRMPFADRSFYFVYSSCTLEHIDDDAIVSTLREAYRILKPGGVIRVAVPDAEKYIRAYLDNNIEQLHYLRYRGKNEHSVRAEFRSWHVPDEFFLPHNQLVASFASYTNIAVGPCLDKESIDRHLRGGDYDVFFKWCASYLKKSPQEQGLGTCTHPSVLNKVYGHVNGLTYGSLAAFFRKAGFSGVYRSEYLQSRSAVLRDPVFDLEERSHLALYVEAVK